MFSCDCCPCTLIIGAIVAFALYKMFCCKKCCRKPELLEKNYKKDVVYMYQFPRASTIPNVSPYCLKVEAFLRLNKIDYENRFSIKARSKHGLLPFIELNGEQIADSQLIEEKLKEHFNVEPLSDYEESVSRAAARLISHHTTSVVSKFRYVDETDSVIDTFFDLANLNQYSFLKPFAVWFIRRKSLKKLKSFGLFSDSEFDMLLRKDLDVIKGLLGEKNYLLGGKISNTDASIFGHIATWYYLPQKGYVARVLDEDYKTIVAWLDRVKTDLFPTDFTKN